MDLNERITDWARKLGYRENIPNSLARICGPSTSIIWEQLLTQVQPKQKVEHIRYNNLIVRLQGRANSQRSEFYPIRELDIWEKRNRLQREIDEIKEVIKEKENVANNFSKHHKILKMKMNKIKIDIRENEGKTFLLIKKSESLQKEALEVEENLTFFRNLTPVEATEDITSVDDTLKECAEKIQALFLEEELKAPKCIKHNIGLTPQKSFLTSIFSQSDDSLENYLQYDEYRNDVLSEIKFIHNKNLSTDLKSILYNVPSQSILNILVKDIDLLKAKLLHIIINKDSTELPLEDHQMDCIMELHGVEIENNLRAIKYAKEIESLTELLKNKEENINIIFEDMITKSAQGNDAHDLFLLQRKEAGLNALCDCVERQLTNCRSVKDGKDELRRINANIMKMQQNLVENLRDINHQYELYKKMYKTILLYRHETKAFVGKLSQYTNDTDWALPLTNSLHTKEIQVFMKFPLEYNRRINTSDSNLYVRNIMTDIAVDVEFINPETSQILLLLLDCPYSAPETIFNKLWEKKIKLQMQKSLNKKIELFKFEAYTLKDLEKQESFVDYAIEKFSELSKKTFNKPSSQDVNTIKETAKLWLEFPFWKYIPQSKLYEGKNITYYQNKYDKYYDQIKK